MGTTTFDQWVEASFDHPATKPEWYRANGFAERWNSLGLSDSVTVEYMTRLFLDPDCLKRYSLDQVAQGIWFLIGESSPARSAHTLLQPTIPVLKRIECVDAMKNFFRAFVAPAAPGAADQKKDPFHIACYMWWDIFPTYGMRDAGEDKFHRTCLNTMEATLTILAELCQLSALHGLNHWHLEYPERVESIVDTYLQNTSGLAPRIIQYAATARAGRAL